MNLESFKPKKGEKFIFVENGEPKAVLVSFDDYRKMEREENENLENERLLGEEGANSLFYQRAKAAESEESDKENQESSRKADTYSTYREYEDAQKDEEEEEDENEENENREKEKDLQETLTVEDLPF